MSGNSSDHSLEEGEGDPQQSETETTVTPLTMEEALAMQQMGLVSSDSDSQQGIQIPVEPGVLIMGNGPLPNREEEDERSIPNEVTEEEGEISQSESQEGE